jgi:DNA-binding XRE family transcriptional regulator
MQQGNWDAYDECQTRNLVEPKVARMMEERRQTMDIAERVRDLRKSRGLTQTELARRVGSTQPSLARFEAGRVPGAGYGFVSRLLNALEAD